MYSGFFIVLVQEFKPAVWLLLVSAQWFAWVQFPAVAIFHRFSLPHEHKAFEALYL